MQPADVLSIQLYTLRSLGNVDHVLDAAQDAGFRHVEMVGSHLADAAAVKAKLDERGLTGTSSHVGLGQLREQPEAMLEAARTLAITELYMPAVPAEERDMDAAGWRSLGSELGKLAERFADQGVTLGYHNHHWELAVKEGDSTALDLLFEGAGSSPLAWQADVAWLVRGGANPEAWLERYTDRLRSAHVKDIAQTGENLDQDGWADVGSGVLYWPGLWKTCRAKGAGWMVVEHDKPADPAATARNSFAYLSRLEA
jgi:sugar phosphate isomerase/epimerase